MARRIGVRVLVFSLGFGPKILKYRWGDTEYCVSAIPLGGYVKMAGEQPGEERSGSEDEFLSKSKWQRFQVLLMGPATNIVFSIFVMAFVLYQGAEVPVYEERSPVVGSVIESSPADLAGIKPGDVILQVSGRPVRTWEEFVIGVLPREGRTTELVILKSSGEQQVTQLTPEAQGRFGMGVIGALPEIRPQVRSVMRGEPADQADIQVGDVIFAVDGVAVVSIKDFVEIIQRRADEAVTLVVGRGEFQKDVVVTPASRDGAGRIGVSLTPESRIIEPGPLEAMGMSIEQNYEWSNLIFRTLGGLFTRETSAAQLMGPVGIAQLAGSASEIGWVALFSLMAMISLNLGILNLLPIPVLDGGHIFVMALEGIRRRDFSTRVKERILTAGFLLLLLLIVVVMYNDIIRILPKE